MKQSSKQPKMPTPSPWKAVVASPAWKLLRKQQRTFVLAHIVNNGDSLDAVKVAYPSATEKSAICMSYLVPKGPRVAAVLELWKSQMVAPVTSRAQLIELVNTHIAAAEPGSIAAQRLSSQLGQLIKRSQEDEAKFEKAVEAVAAARFRVGEIVLQDGHKFQVTAVDDAGQITKAVEVA
jgi:hypothetical protein